MAWLLLIVLIGWPVLALIDDLNRRELARSLAAVLAALRDPEQEASIYLSIDEATVQATDSPRGQGPETG